MQALWIDQDWLTHTDLLKSEIVVKKHRQQQRLSLKLKFRDKASKQAAMSNSEAHALQEYDGLVQTDWLLSLP